MPKRQKFLKNGPYANLMTDLIFKKVFNPDDDYTKVNLVNFLNDILEGELEDPIEDVFSLDKEINASGSHASRTSVFDMHCRDTKKRMFIVEVQIRQMEFFLKRSFFYASQAIVRQGLPGASYDYGFTPVYVVAISWPDIFEDERYPPSFPLRHQYASTEPGFRQLYFHRTSKVSRNRDRFRCATKLDVSVPLSPYHTETTGRNSKRAIHPVTRNDKSC